MAGIVTGPGEQPTLVERLAARVAASTDRRSFLRKAAANTFKGVAIVMAGGGLSVAMATPAWAHCGDSCAHRGAGCPTISGGGECRTCGPSRCCRHVRSGTSSKCNCANGTACKTVSGYCYGRDKRHYATGCWSCTVNAKRSDGCYNRYIIACCDCKTHASRCHDPNSYGDGRGTCVGTAIASGVVC